jgi:hypothetical protein
MSEFLPIENVMKDDMLREYFSLNPKKVDPNSTTFLYYANTLFRKAMSIYEFKGMPDTWDYDYFLSVLLSQGFITVTDTPLGVLPLRCGVSGINVFNHPTTVIIANPVIGNLERTIDEDCTLIKISYDYRGILATVYKYAEMLASCDSSITVNLMNSKVTFIGLVENKQQAQSMKAMYDMITRGEPAVFVKGSQINNDTILYNHVKENFVAGEIQILKRKIMSEFLTEIGVNNANTDKRERLTDNEVEANDSEIQLNAGYWLDNIKEGLEKTNKVFGLDLSVELKNTFNTEGNIENVDIRTAY